MNKKTTKTKEQHFVNKNLVHPGKADNKKGNAILLQAGKKKQINEANSDGSGGAFSATENMRHDDD